MRRVRIRESYAAGRMIPRQTGGKKEARCPRCGRELDVGEALISKLGGHG